MKNAMYLIVAAAIMCQACFISGCGAAVKSYGQGVREKNITRISDILANPSKFEGKTVRVGGKIAEVCPAGCWFNLKDDSGVMYVNIHPNNFFIPQASGRNAAVEGVIEKDGPKVSLIGSGVEIE